LYESKRGNFCLWRSRRKDTNSYVEIMPMIGSKLDGMCQSVG
jgi:hypothetical protein